MGRKRFSDCDLWNQDWFLSLDHKHQLFVFFLHDHCDHAGIWTPNWKRFEQTTGLRINTQDFFQAVNTDKKRIMTLPNARWWLTGFCEDQYNGLALYTNNNAHKGVLLQFENNQVPYKSYGYKVDPNRPSLTLLGSQDKDKDKESINIGISDIQDGECEGKDNTILPLNVNARPVNLTNVNSYYDRFKAAYPPDMTALNPECENWFANNEESEDKEAAVKGALNFAVYTRLRCVADGVEYPHHKFKCSAISFLAKKKYLENWHAKAISEGLERREYQGGA